MPVARRVAENATTTAEEDITSMHNGSLEDRAAVNLILQAYEEIYPNNQNVVVDIRRRSLAEGENLDTENNTVNVLDDEHSNIPEESHISGTQENLVENT